MTTATISFTELLTAYHRVRQQTRDICKHLETEDYVVQPVEEVSPPKWHLGHTTWFFETFILRPHASWYQQFNAAFDFLFNSYYESVGARVIRTDRGNLSRPGVSQVLAYRAYVDEAMNRLLKDHSENPALEQLTVLGLNHEQQHQELLLTDIKYILGHNPLFPAFNIESRQEKVPSGKPGWISFPEGLYEIGAKGDGFCWDNELGRHKVFIGAFQISAKLVTNAEYLEFMQDGGYTDFRHWHSEGWQWLKANLIEAPMYWHRLSGQWMNYDFSGLVPVDPEQPVCHLSYYEASAFASWKKMRLPTEFEWEAAAAGFCWGERWEWTGSAYLPYPDYQKADGALGEYNGKFMVNQQVLRGASVATPIGHSRASYRNFFPAHTRWQYTGIRLVK